MLLEDLKHAFRVLSKSPGFTAVAVLVLALGIGANSAIFSVVNAVLLRPLPFSNAARLVQIWHTPPAKSFPGITEFTVSAANYLDWARDNLVFDKTAIYRFARFDVMAGGNPESIKASAVESTFFSVFGVHPILGRTFVAEEDEAGHGKLVVLGYDFWRNRFGSDPRVIGRKIRLDNAAYTVIGVMGPKFRHPDFAKIWTPLEWTAKERAVRGEHHFLVDVDPGLNSHNVLTMTVSIGPNKFATPARENIFFATLLRQVRAVPGVQSAALIDDLPMSGNGSTQPVEIADRPVVATADQPEVAVRVVSADYMKTMGIKLLRGRHLVEADTAKSHGVVLISESAAKQFWPDKNPLGQHLTLTFFPNIVRAVVGVNADVKQYGLDAMWSGRHIRWIPPCLSSMSPPWMTCLLTRSHNGG